jgi:hypothetical protein
MAPAPKKLLGLPLPALAVLLAYALLLSFFLLHYQAWEDEGRAWMDARFFGLFNLIFHTLRYEGHPALWYLLLWPLAHLHLPFQALNAVAAACALAGVWFLLRHAPFPFYLRALLPFGFTLAYEYAIVARGYVLFPLLGFLVAHQYRQPTRRPIRMAIALALLANLTVHGTLVAVVFGMSYAWQLYTERRTQPIPTWTLREARLAATLFAASLAFVAIVLWPARDLKAPVGPRLGNLIHRAAPATYNPASPHPHLLPIAAAIPPETIPYAPNLGMGLAALNLRQRLWTVFIYPVASFAPLAILLEALTLALIWQRRRPILLLAPALVGVFIILVYLKLWHVGMVWVTLLLVLWAVWDQQATPRPALTLQNALAAVLTLVGLLQIAGTIGAIRFVSTHRTYPALAAANFVKSLPRRTRVDGFDHAFTLLPYFRRTFPYRHYADTLDLSKLLADPPDAILFRDSTIPADQLAQLSQAGFHPTQTFCGTPYFPDQPLVPLCLVIWQK